MSTSEDDEAFGHDPFGLRDLWGRNRGSPSPASAASASAAASGAPFAKQAKKRSQSCPADMSPQGTERFENTLIQYTQSLQHDEQDNNGVNNSSSVAASGAPCGVAPSPLVVASPASAIASVAASTAGVIDEACQLSIPPLSDQSVSAWARSAELPRHRPMVTMARWRHKANLHGPLEQLVANCQASIADDPIQIVPPIGQEQTVSQTVAKLLGIIDAEVALGKRARVYVGACVDVARRWHGTTRAEFEAYRTQPLSGTTSTPAKRRQWLYPGHKRKYTKMFVLASAHALVGKDLEGLMISVAKCRCEGDDALHGENGPPDGRGQALDHNWIYVCIGDGMPVVQRPSPFALS